MLAAAQKVWQPSSLMSKQVPWPVLDLWWTLVSLIDTTSHWELYVPVLRGKMKSWYLPLEKYPWTADINLPTRREESLPLPWEQPHPKLKTVPQRLQCHCQSKGLTLSRSLPWAWSCIDKGRRWEVSLMAMGLLLFPPAQSSSVLPNTQLKKHHSGHQHRITRIRHLAPTLCKWPLVTLRSIYQLAPAKKNSNW